MTATVQVPAARVAAWLDGFARRNGTILTSTYDDQKLTLRTDRGATAVFTVDVPGFAAAPDDVAPDLKALVSWATAPRTLAVVLVRRGGYTVGDVHLADVGKPPQLRASKTGTRYVQGRTAAGGQSQQRFARRRANQADALVGSAQDAAFGVLGGRAKPFDLLVTGGDHDLIDQTLADPRLRWLTALPVTRFVEVGDPRQRTIAEAVTKALSVTVEVTNAPTTPSEKD